MFLYLSRSFSGLFEQELRVPYRQPWLDSGCRGRLLTFVDCGRTRCGRLMWSLCSPVFPPGGWGCNANAASRAPGSPTLRLWATCSQGWGSLKQGQPPALYRRGSFFSFPSELVRHPPAAPPLLGRLCPRGWCRANATQVHSHENTGWRTSLGGSQSATEKEDPLLQPLRVGTSRTCRHQEEGCVPVCDQEGSRLWG